MSSTCVRSSVPHKVQRCQGCVRTCVLLQHHLFFDVVKRVVGVVAGEARGRGRVRGWTTQQELRSVGRARGLSAKKQRRGRDTRCAGHDSREIHDLAFSYYPPHLSCTYIRM